MFSVFKLAHWVIFVNSLPRPGLGHEKQEKLRKPSKKTNNCIFFFVCVCVCCACVRVCVCVCVCVCVWCVCVCGVCVCVCACVCVCFSWPAVALGPLLSASFVHCGGARFIFPGLGIIGSGLATVRRNNIFLRSVRLCRTF